MGIEIDYKFVLFPLTPLKVEKTFICQRSKRPNIHNKTFLESIAREPIQETKEILH
jgi:hypothetical protein